MSDSSLPEYEALARKYRPQTFADVIGQEHVIAALRNALETKRIHHAYLLTGTRGIGKTTIARILAKCLQCEKGITYEPCLKCDNCQMIAKGVHPDVFEIDAASQTKVDDTRKILDNTLYPPALPTSHYKIYIIDEVHMLSQSSFNALLKTLEEPPEYVKFILATTDPQKIPATVLSRCLQFSLKALSLEQIGRQLLNICNKEQIAYEDGAIRLLSRAAHGSMRDALSLCDQALALGSGSLQEKSVIAMLGTAGDGLIGSILELLSPQPTLTLSEVLNSIHQLAPNYKNLLDELVLTFHDLALYQFTKQTKLDVFSMPEHILAYASRFDAKTLQLYYQIALQGLLEYKTASDGSQVFDMALLRLLAFTPEKKKLG
ncbi:MAG: DNA polymerase III subunit gamma/tau [Succinivibrio sp.]|nr:DNA polymerase III subunit gamma/tau [Succinivibrio sp.]